MPRVAFRLSTLKGNASVFEINRSDWILEYDSIDPNRQSQGLLWIRRSG
ncbi:MAG: hypothetical protein J7L99_02505 [Planctomycetes bacterium]|nr:hypothetical protein [Planctomycetota bacterium]